MSILKDLEDLYPEQKEFRQAVGDVFDDLDDFLKEHKEYKENEVLQRLAEPDRSIQFRVTWQDEDGNINTNRGWRVQYSNAIGPYKGGLRFHPAVSLDTFKFLGFEQTLKNALTGLQMGGAKRGGVILTPRTAVMRIF
jgi:glutamate dehydrogenase (NADP+)